MEFTDKKESGMPDSFEPIRSAKDNTGSGFGQLWYFQKWLKYKNLSK